MKINNYDVHRHAITRSGKIVAIRVNDPSNFDTSPDKPYAYYDDESKTWRSINDKGCHWSTGQTDHDVVMWKDDLPVVPTKDLRDEFAIGAMPIFFTCYTADYNVAAKMAYKMADAMLKAREVSYGISN